MYCFYAFKNSCPPPLPFSGKRLLKRGLFFFLGEDLLLCLSAVPPPQKKKKKKKYNNNNNNKIKNKKSWIFPYLEQVKTKI